MSTSSCLGEVDSYLGVVFSFGGCTHVSGCDLHFRATVRNGVVVHVRYAKAIVARFRDFETI